MSTKDIQLFENGSGGEMLILNNDLALNESLFQSIYIALFGGNREQNNVQNENLDWWGNDLLFKNKSTKKFISETERTLQSTVLNSKGRQVIISAVEKDLQFLNGVAIFEVNVSIISYDSVKISIFLTDANQELEMIWSNAKNQLISNKII